MATTDLHSLVRKGDLEGVRRLLRDDAPGGRGAVDRPDRHGLSALVHAVTEANVDVTMVQLLLEHGANVAQVVPSDSGIGNNVLARALSAGDPRKVAALLEAGADLFYHSEADYDCLLDAVHGRDVARDPRLLELLALLISHRAPLGGISSYRESGLRTLSRLGRFDAVRLLLDAGANESDLAWTPLIRAVAVGGLAEVRERVHEGAALEAKDWWERTAWLVAVQAGDIAKAAFLRDSGAKVGARGRCGKPPLFYAIESHKPDMLRWLLESGQDPEQTDEFGETPLNEAVGGDDTECLELLLNAGVEVDRRHNSSTALNGAQSKRVATRLLEAGADPGELGHAGHRLLLNYPAVSEDPLLDVTPEEFRAGRSPRFGKVHAELHSERFWEAMIRSGVNGYVANELFKGPSSLEAGPVWCAERFGQSITVLPGGTVIQVGGEHEDHYDPDFRIYNDVFVHGADGKIRIFGYPEADFPPTDFHTATLVDRHLYLIGCLGYRPQRRPGYTPVFRLDTSDYRIERLETRGEFPGWIYDHRALLTAPHEIRISGGKCVAPGGDLIPNEDRFILDLKRLVWRRDRSAPGQ